MLFNKKAKNNKKVDEDKIMEMIYLCIDIKSDLNTARKRIENAMSEKNSSVPEMSECEMILLDHWIETNQRHIEMIERRFKSLTEEELKLLQKRI